MYHNSATACDRHLAKQMRHVLGNASSKKVEVVRTQKQDDNGLHFCDCGKFADFQIVADRGGRNGTTA